MEISSVEKTQHTTTTPTPAPLISSSSSSSSSSNDVVLEQHQQQQQHDIALDQEEQQQQQQHVVVTEPTLNNGEMEQKLEMSRDEVKSALELSASTGKFWIDWDKLKSLLSFQLKQVWGGSGAQAPAVLSEYAEAKMNVDQQISALGETFLEYVKRLDTALSSFYEGPPFTLQRLCEILLTAKSTYPTLTKLASALEKNLLVTSTLTRCTDPCPPPVMLKPDNELMKVNEEIEPPAPVSSNGVEIMVGDGDEIMAEVEEADTDEAMTIDTEAFEEKVGLEEKVGTKENVGSEETAGLMESSSIQDKTKAEQPLQA